MSCRLCQELIQARLDDPLCTPEADPVLDQHLRECPECAGLFRAARRLDAGLRRLTPPLPPDDLVDRVTAAVHDDQDRRRRFRLAGALCGLAAGLLVALGLRFLPGKTNPSGPNPQVAKQEKPAPGPAPEHPEDPPVEIGTVLATATTRVADETVKETRELIPAVVGPALGDMNLGSALESPTRPLREAGSGVSTGLEPVTDSARRAVGLFLQELPPMGGSLDPGY